MITRPQIRRGIFLVELVVVIILGAGMMWVLGKLLLDGLYLQRLAGQHEARASSMVTLTQRLRDDALAATSYRWEAGDPGGMLVINRCVDGVSSLVRYAVLSDRVSRSNDGGESDAWQAERLCFAARVESGPCADIFQVDFVELPPPRAPMLSPRQSSVSVLLPPAVGGILAQDAQP